MAQHFCNSKDANPPKPTEVSEDENPVDEFDLISI